MLNQLRFGKKLKLPSTTQLKQALRHMQWQDEEDQRIAAEKVTLKDAQQQEGS